MEQNVVKNKKKRSKPEIFFIIIGVVLVLYCLSLICSLLWGFIISFQDYNIYESYTLSFPKKFYFKNYEVVFANFGVPSGLTVDERIWYNENTSIGSRLLALTLNTLGYCLGSTLCWVFSMCTVAYCCAKFSKFKIAGVYVAIVIVAMALPAVGTQAAFIKMMQTFGLYDSVLGMCVIKIEFTGMYFLVFHATFKGIPKDYSDAAYIDGANNFTIYFKLMLPLVVKTFTTISLITFVLFWNDYQTPLIYMPSFPTLASSAYEIMYIKMQAIDGSGPNYNIMKSDPGKLAACMILLIPMLIVFIAFQKQLMGNVSVGGLKE